MTRRKEKQKQHVVVDAYVMSGALTVDQGQQFKAMYSRARSSDETAAVGIALHNLLDGWKSGTDLFSRLLQEGHDLNEEDDDDPPALREALARSRVVLTKP